VVSAVLTRLCNTADNSEHRQHREQLAQAEHQSPWHFFFLNDNRIHKLKGSMKIIKAKQNQLMLGVEPF